MKSVFDKNPLNALHSVRPLYGAAFMMAISLNAWWTTMPFIVRNMGGSEDHVGYAWAANMFSYLVCLLLAGSLLGQHNPKNTTRIAVVIIFLSLLTMSVLVYLILAKGLLGNVVLIWTVILVGMVAGGALSLYWPFLMSWVSEDFEGQTLNRRLGTYNGAWSGAAIIGPMLGGILVEANTVLPIVFSAASMITCFLFLSMVSDDSVQTKLFGDKKDSPVAGCQSRKELMRFRWIARISMFSSWACLGVTRSQFALVFTDIGYSETWFGILVTIFSACNFAALTAAGRCSFWHFKFVPLPTVQILLSVSLLMIVYGRSLPIFVLSFVIMGCCFGFAYSSHQYYGACGSKKRSVQMAVHETTICLGIVVGSGTGGYLAKNVGIYQPYWFAMMLLAVGLLIQMVLLPKDKYHRKSIK